MHLLLLASNPHLLDTLSTLIAACPSSHSTTTTLIPPSLHSLPHTTADALILALEHTPHQPHRFAVALRAQWPQQPLIAIFHHTPPSLATLTALSLNAVFFTWPNPHTLERILSLPPTGLFLDATAAAILTHASNSSLDDLFAILTPREREVLACLASGASNTTIANALGIAYSTLRSHINNLYTKLGVSSRNELITLAHQFIHLSTSP